MNALVFSLVSALAPTQPPTQAPRVWIEDPVQLSALEQRGLDASRVAFDRAGGVDASRTRALKDAPGWRTIVDTLKADVRALYAKDKAYGVGMRFSHRAFDFTWLDATDVRFELAAVANRVDRRPFARDANDAPRATCGELRVLYRLAYATTTKAGPFSSRLPMTMNVVFWLPPEPDGGCAKAARALEQDLPALVPTLARKSVEVNVQTLRWPSTVRPDLGGHAEYVLRVFEQTKDGLVPAPLENTPDIERIARSPALRAQALAWLRDAATAQGAVDGLALMPRTLAATRAVSATPRGLARAPNRHGDSDHD